MQQTPEHYVPERMDRPVCGSKTNGVRVRITPQGKTTKSRVRGTNGIPGTARENPGGFHDGGPPLIDRRNQGSGRDGATCGTPNTRVLRDTAAGCNSHTNKSATSGSGQRRRGYPSTDGAIPARARSRGTTDREWVLLGDDQRIRPLEPTGVPEEGTGGRQNERPGRPAVLAGGPNRPYPFSAQCPYSRMVGEVRG